MANGSEIWRTDAVIRRYLDAGREALPFAGVQTDLLLRILRALTPDLTSFLDLGCGDGAMGRALLSVWPDAKGVFLDFAAPMLAAARERLGGDAGRHAFVQEDFGRPEWVRALADYAPFDAVVSGFSIHHQPNARKRAIYADVFRLLRPGGAFLNLEHVASVAPWAEAVSDDCFVDSLLAVERSRGGPATREEIARRFAERPDKAANILAPVEAQCRWLREVGFADVDCHFRALELALLGGVRPRAAAQAARVALQDQYAPMGRCFGCGSINDRGLRLKSHVEGEEVVADWTPEPHHQAFEGVLSGGIIGVLLDCHGNWTAAWALMRRRGDAKPRVTVTAEYSVHLRRPTPADRPVHLRAHATELSDDRATIEGALESDGAVTATFRGVFVAVKGDHPAHGAW